MTTQSVQSRPSGVQQYRKKPVVIEAMKFDGSRRSADAVSLWLAQNDTECSGMYGEIAFVKIPTLEGEMVANVGDWIIRGIKGEFYPCKPDIFDATYEAVES